MKPFVEVRGGDEKRARVLINLSNAMYIDLYKDGTVMVSWPTGGDVVSTLFSGDEAKRIVKWLEENSA